MAKHQLPYTLALAATLAPAVQAHPTNPPRVASGQAYHCPATGNWQNTRDTKLERRDPAAAAQAYRAFLRANPDLPAAGAIDALVVIIDLYQNHLRDPSTANAIRTWALLHYAGAPERTRLLASGILVVAAPPSKLATTPAKAPGTTPVNPSSPSAPAAAAIPAFNPGAFAADDANWRQLQALMGAMAQSNPGLAALRYRSYLRRNPNLQPKVAIAVLAAAIDLYEDQLHDTVAAAALRQYGLKTYASLPEHSLLLPFASSGLKAWTRLRAANAPQEGAKPALAAITYWHFLANHPDVEPQVIAEAAAILVPLYHDKLKDSGAGATIRDWAIRQCAGHPELIRNLNLLTSRTAPFTSLPYCTAVSEFYRPEEGTNGTKGGVVDFASASRDQIRDLKLNLGQQRDCAATECPYVPLVPFCGYQKVSVAKTAIVDELRLVPLAAKQALRLVPPPAGLTPAQLWNLPNDAIKTVAPPAPGYTPAMLNDQARQIVQDLQAGRLLNLPPSTHRRTLITQGEQKLALAHEAQLKREAVQLNLLYARARTDFWTAEPLNVDRTDPAALAALQQPAAKEAHFYRAAAINAEAFLQLQFSEGRADARTAPVLYLAALARTSTVLTGTAPTNAEQATVAHATALQWLDWLLRDYPEYRDPKADQANVDNALLNPQPAPELLKLRLYHLAQLAAPTTAQSSATLPAYLTDALQIQSSLQLLTEITAQAMTARQADAAEPASQASVSDSVATPAQLRAAALPATVTLVTGLHEALLPIALQREGVRNVRTYLRGLLGPAAAANVSTAGVPDSAHPLAAYAAAKLVAIDQEILVPYRTQAEQAISQKGWNDARAWLQKIIGEYDGLPPAKQARDRVAFVNLSQYQDDAKVALAQFRFSDARALYNRIKAEFPGTAAAAAADEAIKGAVPVAVKYYREMGDKCFTVETQPWKPQTAARKMYAEMYSEDPDGPQSDYALLRLSRALATEGQIQEAQKNLKGLVASRRDSDMRPEAMFLLGFYDGASKPAQFSSGCAWFEKLVKEYPKSPFVPEALWYGAFYMSFQGKSRDGIPLLLRIKQQYADSPRSKWVDNWVTVWSK